MSFLRIIAILLFAAWLVLVLAGRGGLVHIFVFSGFAVLVVDLMTIYRSRLVP